MRITKKNLSLVKYLQKEHKKLNIKITIKIFKTMKRTGVLIILVLGMFFSGFAQDYYTVLEDQLTTEQKAVITEAKATVTKAEGLIKKAEAEEVKNAKLIASDKKGKQKKAEKKLVDAKKYRISAATKYDEAYSSIFNMYMEILNSAEYIFVEDGSQSQKYTDDANTNFADGQRVLAKYQELKTEAALEKKAYSTLKSDLASMITYEETGLQMVVDAILLWKGQENKKKERDNADKAAWENAKKIDKIASYKNYLATYPDGAYAKDAADKIEELEEAFLSSQTTATATGKKIVYKIQILADKTEWSNSNIKAKIYSGTETIEKRYADGYYKYSIGEFKTYAEAKNFKNKVGNGAFVICFVEGKQVDILDALKVEGVKP